jgi:hypothetical protein
MPITINGSGTITGASTLATTVVSPTLTTATLTTPNINSAQFATVLGTAPLYAARAWVNFNGTGTVAINASGNVTSITDNGTGDYTVNFTTAMSDANYANSLSVQVAAATFFRSAYVTDTGKAAGSLRFLTVNAANANADFPGVDVAIFR